MKVLENLRYSKDHEWVRIEGTQAVVGITDYAQHELGDVVFIELPPVGKKIKAHTTLTTIESVKAVSDIFAPLSGTIIKVNEQLNDNPELVNQQPYEAGWIFAVELENPAEVTQLLDAAQYSELLEENNMGGNYLPNTDQDRQAMLDAIGVACLTIYSPTSRKTSAYSNA